MKLGCLFGSGISLKAGYLGVSEITEVILSGKNISRHSDSEYHFSPPPFMGVEECESVKRVTVFLQYLFNENKLYNNKFKNDQPPNYEDLYYTLRQIHDEIYGEQENLIVRDYINNLTIDNVTMLKANLGLYDDFSFNELVDESMTYINNVATRLLYMPKNDISYLSMIKEISSKYDTDLFSLNHDLLLETYFEKNNIAYCDGFSLPKGDFKHFDLDLFSNKNSINLLKLHGSSNWYRFRAKNSDWRGEFIGKCIHNDINHAKDENDEFVNYLWNKSIILTGTFNKLIDYNSGIFSDLFCLFSNKLDQIETLIISGYGFGDVGINTKIIEWYYKNSKTKIILIHKNSDELKEKARGAISNKWDNWIHEGRLLILNKWFEEVTFDELHKLL